VCDVTRTYVVGDAPTPFQRDLYQIVLSAQQRAIAACRPGEEWKEIHLRCAVDLTAGLIELGVMHGAAESLVEQEAHTLFFPHGLGHLVGLGVRDASGTLPDRPKDPRPCLRTLRTDLPLAPGYVITVEPGLYFIPALLNDPVRRERFRDCVNWAIAEQHLGIGGVRIEDNLVITTGEPENLTAAIPRML
jgi:Xaa-Pro aminopeptidase